ncbi:MAG: serine/threonine-protein kinase [Planctomycetota bacterium]
MIASQSDSSLQWLSSSQLSDSKQERLAELLDLYLRGLEQGLAPSVEELVEDDEQDLIEPLRGYVDRLQDLHRIAVGFEPAATDEPVAEHGRQLGDFELLDEVGRGGMGVVYRARQISLGREVAIKLLPTATVLDSRQIERFRNEAQAAASLNHPNIVPVYAVGCERGVHYYAMQLIDGCSLEERIDQLKQAERLPDWRSMVELTVQAAEALAAAHKMGVIHRDIKPSNLMIDRDGRLWVTDFGLARYRTDVSLTQTGDIVGTMRYMSPEQACGESALVDGRTDVFSLAVTLYEMLCLRPAHDAEDALGVLRCLDRGLTAPLRTVRTDLPRDLETVVDKAMSAERGKRYANATEFADDLRRVLDGRPTIARPPSTLDRLESRVAKHRRAVALTLLLSVCGLFGLTIGIAAIAAAKRDSDSHARRLGQFKNVYNDSFDRLAHQIERLGEVPGTDSMRRQLMREMLFAYEELAVRADRDPLLKEDLAMTYAKIGNLHAELGDNLKAVESLARSESMYAELSVTNDHVISEGWAICQNSLARAHHRMGDFESSARWFGRSIDSHERLLDDAPSSERAIAQQNLAAALSNLGLLLTDCGAVDKAETVFQRAIELAESGNATEEQLATYHSNLSGLFATIDAARSAEHAQRALDIQLRALDSNADDIGLTTKVMVSLNHLGKSLAKRGEHAAAVKTFDRAIAIGQPLHLRWPNQPNLRRDLVISLNQRGLSLSAERDQKNAATSFRKALAIQTALAETYSDNAEVLSMTANVLNNLGFVQRQLGEDNEAQNSFAEAVRYQTTATQLAPQVARYRAFLAKHRQNLTEFGGPL